MRMATTMRTMLAACLLCASAQAAEVRGIVSDSSGAGIPHARIEMRDEKRVISVFADEAGSFRLQTAAAQGAVTASARGFSPLTLNWNGSPEALQFTLQLASAAEEIVVTAERGKTPIAATSSNIASLNSTELETHAASTLDDSLRQVPGFTLFRRTSSLTANPTTQGASVRGIGASGASRILALEDGIPLNDAFGGWIYWDQTPRISLERAEVLRGGGANLYGNAALAGVVDLVTLPPANLAEMETSGDSLNGHDVQGYLSHRFSRWTLSATGESFGNDGSFIVGPLDRGLVDAPADLQFGNARTRIERTFGPNVGVFATGSLFAEQRGNGTLLQVNSTHWGELTTGLDAATGNNLWTLRAYGTGEHYHQSFSSIAVNRNSESLARWQTVPSDQIGFSAQWTRSFAAARITAGIDSRFVHGESDDTVFTSGLATSLIAAGGTNRNTGIFGEISGSPAKRLHLSAGVRGDWWSNLNGFSRTTVLKTGKLTPAQLASHDEQAFSPRAGLVYDVAGPLQITASSYGAFRAPTLNELYRTFRLGNVVTNANEQLRAEHLAGGEAGLRYVRNHLILSGVFFYEHVDNPVANVTLSSTPALITRQRQNLGALRAQGIDADALLVLRRIQVRAGYEYVDSQVTSFSADPTLIGKVVPETPAHVFTISTVYNAPHRWNVEALLRASSRQFDDDQNLLVLDPYSTVGVSISKGIGPTTWFLSAANLFNSNVEIAATPVPTLGSPRIVSGGVRLQFGAR